MTTSRNHAYLCWDLDATDEGFSVVFATNHETARERSLPAVLGEPVADAEDYEIVVVHVPQFDRYADTEKVPDALLDRVRCHADGTLTGLPEADE